MSCQVNYDEFPIHFVHKYVIVVTLVDYMLTLS